MNVKVKVDFPDLEHSFITYSKISFDRIHVKNTIKNIIFEFRKLLEMTVLKQ